MPKRIEDIVYRFAQMMKLIFGSNLDKVIVYGSYARGNYRKNSDVDVMILVDLPENEIKKMENTVYDVAFDIEMETGVDISPVIKSRQQFEYWVDTLPYYRNVREEGVTVFESQFQYAEKIVAEIKKYIFDICK